MMAVGDQRRRLVALALRDEDPRPYAVDRGGKAVDREALPGRVDHVRRLPRAPDLGEDEQRGHDDQHALQHGGEIFRLVVAVLVLEIGRLVADADRPEGGTGGDDVDDGFQRVRIERDGAGHPPRDEFQPHHRKGDEDRPDGEPPYALLDFARHRPNLRLP